MDRGNKQKRDLLLGPLTGRVFALSAFLLLAFASAGGAPNTRLVLLGEFQPYTSKKNPEVALKIQELLRMKLIRSGFRVRPAPLAPAGRLPASARGSGARFYVGGYYRRSSLGNLNLYGQIYHPEAGHIIPDARHPSRS